MGQESISKELVKPEQLNLDMILVTKQCREDFENEKNEILQHRRLMGP